MCKLAMASFSHIILQRTWVRIRKCVGKKPSMVGISMTLKPQKIAHSFFKLSQRHVLFPRPSFIKAYRPCQKFYHLLTGPIHHPERIPSYYLEVCPRSYCSILTEGQMAYPSCFPGTHIFIYELRTYVAQWETLKA